MDTKDQWQSRMIHSPPPSSEVSEVPPNIATTVADSTSARRPYHTWWKLLWEVGPHLTGTVFFRALKQFDIRMGAGHYHYSTGWSVGFLISSDFIYSLIHRFVIECYLWECVYSKMCSTCTIMMYLLLYDQMNIMIICVVVWSNVVIAIVVYIILFLSCCGDDKILQKWNYVVRVQIQFQELAYDCFTPFRKGCDLNVWNILSFSDVHFFLPLQSRTTYLPHQLVCPNQFWNLLK